MTAEAYLMIYKKIWATIRHDIWFQVEEKKKQQRTEKLSKEELTDISNSVHDNFENIRTEIYAKIMEDEEITAV